MGKSEQDGDPFAGFTYSLEQRAAILDAFAMKLDIFGQKIDDHHLMESLEGAASFYVNYRDALRVPDLAPSQQARYWKGVGNKLRSAQSALKDASRHVRRMPEMHAAAVDLANLDGVLPDFGPERVPIEGASGNAARDHVRIWPVERQVERIANLLGWAVRVADRASERSTWLAMGKGPDEALHQFVRQIDQTYRSLAADPRNPRTEDHTNNLKGGDLLRLLDACLRPLGIALTPESMASLWRRACTTVRVGRRGARSYTRSKRPNTGKRPTERA